MPVFISYSHQELNFVDNLIKPPKSGPSLGLGFSYLFSLISNFHQIILYLFGGLFANKYVVREEDS
jgi:hypothetical protein